jgi:GAF domain-containing protein
MLPAPIPANEKERFDALRRLLILDTPPEQRFDKVVNFASQEFNVPICLISLIDQDRQWFKARVGLEVCETARDISFCGHAILHDDIMVVEDARVDERFIDNPLVLGDPFIRFYAGAPLVLPDGHAVGTLCLIDTRPRKLDDMDLYIMATLRDLLVAELVGEPALEESAAPADHEAAGTQSIREPGDA